MVEVVPSPGPPCDALVAFTGHHVLAADVDPSEVEARYPAGELTVPFSPSSLMWLEERLGRSERSRPAGDVERLATSLDGSAGRVHLRGRVIGATPTSGAGTPQSTAAFIAGEQDKWRALAQELGVQPQ